MKCPKCWTEKAYRHPQQGWKARLLMCLSLVSMKCHHCYHKFHTPWFATIGQTMLPPTIGTGADGDPQILPFGRSGKRPAANDTGQRRQAA